MMYIQVLSKFYIGSHHRLVRSQVVIRLKSEQYKTIKKKKKTEMVTIGLS